MFSMTMDGFTDSSANEQETLFVRTCTSGKITSRFLCTGEPILWSTCVDDLHIFVVDKISEHHIEHHKLTLKILILNLSDSVPMEPIVWWGSCQAWKQVTHNLVIYALRIRLAYWLSPIKKIKSKIYEKNAIGLQFLVGSGYFCLSVCLFFCLFLV